MPTNSLIKPFHVSEFPKKVEKKIVKHIIIIFWIDGCMDDYFLMKMLNYSSLLVLVVKCLAWYISERSKVPALIWVEKHEFGLLFAYKCKCHF